MAMRFGRQLLAAFALCLMSAFGVNAQQTGTITGRVTDAESGNPIAGASVEVMTAGGRVVATGLSDQEGSFRVANVPPGTYSLVFMYVGHQTTRIPDVRVLAGETTMTGASLASSAFILNPVVISVGREEQKAVSAPGSITSVSQEEVERRPAVSPVDHLRTTPGLDVASYGVQSTNVVARGFNNIFSGALHLLTDHRIASVPSLRVNYVHFAPLSNDDIERMEVVLGPGSALYGPNTASGVLHILTRSPLEQSGSSLSVAGGEQSILQVAGRTSHRLSDQFGFKVSGQYLKAKEWAYADPIEGVERAKYSSTTPPFDRNFFRLDLMRAVGIDSVEAVRRIGLIGNRDNDIERWSGEARADWRPSERLHTAFTAGIMNLGTGIELTGLGAGVAKDWRNSFYQARANYGRLFGQVYLNMSDAGDTYLLRNGAPIVDKSRMWVAQLQHGLSLGTRQSFTYGLDYQKTDPRTDGTINGIYEDEDETTETGVYLQSQTAISPKLDLVLAGRYDDHTAIPDPIFSPRAAIVFKPTDAQAFRLTYNRAFSTPTSLNQFLDLGSAIPDNAAAQLGYSVRVQGTGRNGFRFAQSGGGFLMRSPFTPAAAGGPATLLPADAAAFFPAAVQVLAAGAAARGQPLPANLVAYLSTLRPTSAQIGTDYRNVATGASGSLASFTLPDIKPIRESTTTTFEAGYKGILGDRFSISVDAWMERRDQLVTPLTTLTPLLLMNGPQLVAYLTPLFVANLGMTPAAAQVTAISLAGSAATPGLATIPVGVISSADVNASGPQLLFTYYNVDDHVDYWGIDLAATALLSDVWTLSGTLSFVNENVFQTDRGESVTLNAPKTKGSVALNYNNTRRGFNGELRARYNDEFPVRSGVYNATLCIGGQEAGAEPCIESFTLLDALLGYNLPIAGASIQLSVQNLLDEDYRSFPGVPNIGRMALLRLRYEF
jgi:iron complex outermembrane receptor protein